jgi:Arc/MetJ family transcription regulator
MRTTLDLNEALLNEAMQWTGIFTKTAVINEALKEVIAHKKRMRLIEMAGNVKLDVDLNITRARK